MRIQRNMKYSKAVVLPCSPVIFFQITIKNKFNSRRSFIINQEWNSWGKRYTIISKHMYFVSIELNIVLWVKLGLFFQYYLKLTEVKQSNYRMLAERSKACTVYDRLNIGIAVSNPVWGMDVCPRVSVLCCPVSVEALRRADPPSKESYQMSLYVDREAH
jgi:hypothetical protein